MKHIFISALASAVLIFAAACSSENSQDTLIEPVAVSQTTLSVILPETTTASTSTTSAPISIPTSTTTTTTLPSITTTTSTTTTEPAFPLIIVAEINRPAYDRSDYGSFRANVDRALGWNKTDCKWAFYASTPRNCPTEDAGKANNRDHMVPVADAHRSGGYAWSGERKKDFYSHTDNLFVISASENKSKSDKDPAEWRPANPNAHCEYARQWIKLKTEWNLTADQSEADALKQMLQLC